MFKQNSFKIKRQQQIKINFARFIALCFQLMRHEAKNVFVCVSSRDVNVKTKVKAKLYGTQCVAKGRRHYD